MQVLKYIVTENKAPIIMIKLSIKWVPAHVQGSKPCTEPGV